jgi:hypothetical protein
VGTAETEMAKMAKIKRRSVGGEKYRRRRSNNESAIENRRLCLICRRNNLRRGVNGNENIGCQLIGGAGIKESRGNEENISSGNGGVMAAAINKAIISSAGNLASAASMAAAKLYRRRKLSKWRSWLS